MTRAVLMIILLLAAAATPAHAQGDARAEAKKLLDDGVRLYKAGQLEGALDRFDRAYERLPSPGLLLNIGTTQRKLGRNAEAANTYQRYIDDPAAETAKIAEVEKSLAELDRNLGLLLLNATAGGAEVQIGTGPWRAAGEVRMVRVGPGAQVIRARKGDLVVEVTVVVGAGERKEVQMPQPRPEPPKKPRPEPAKKVNQPTPRAPVGDDDDDDDDGEIIITRDRGKTRRLIGIGVGALGLASAGVGVGFAIRAKGRFGDARDLCGADGCPPGPDYDRSRALSDAGMRDRRLSMVLIGAGAATAVAGAVLWFTAPRAERRVAVAVAPDQLGITLAGRF
jgi:hypothetical protein